MPLACEDGIVTRPSTSGATFRVGQDPARLRRIGSLACIGAATLFVGLAWGAAVPVPTDPGAIDAHVLRTLVAPLAIAASLVVLALKAPPALRLVLGGVALALALTLGLFRGMVAFTVVASVEDIDRLVIAQHEDLERRTALMRAGIVGLSSAAVVAEEGQAGLNTQNRAVR